MSRRLTIAIPVGVMMLVGTSYIEEKHAATSDAECAVPSVEAAPVDCNSRPLPHSRTIYASGLAVANSTASTVTWTQAACVVFDAEDVQPVEPRMPYVNFGPPITSRST